MNGRSISFSIFVMAFYGALPMPSSAGSAPAAPLKPGLPWVQFHDADFNRPATSGVDGQINLDTGRTIQDYSRYWCGLLKAPVDGEIRFFAEADNGVQLTIAETIVLDGWGPDKARDGTLTVAPGQLLPLEIRFFQNGGTAHLRLFWSWASRPRELIPPTAFWHRDADAQRVRKMLDAGGPAMPARADKSAIYRPGAHDASTSTKPRLLGPGPYLFIDDALIDTCTHVERKVNKPKRDLGEPVVTGAKDHGDDCFQPYLTVVRDPQTGQFRIWYGVPESAGQSHVAYMESDDGIHWVRPHRVLKDPSPIRFGVSVIDEGRLFPDRSQRFKLGYYGDGGLRVAISSDGLAWKLMVPRTVLRHNHDINNIFRDPLRRRYLAMVNSYIPGERWTGRRRVPMLSISDDLVHWRRPWIAVAPDDSLDDGQTQFYGMCGFLTRGDLLIGMVKVLRDDLPADPGEPARGIGYTALVWSRDGEHWTRDREVFFDRDPRKGSWDHAMAWIDCQLPVGDEVYLYYGGYAQGHKVNRFEERQIGLVRMTRDRYVARRAEDTTGRLRTVPLQLPSDGTHWLALNADASGGRIRVQLRDARTGDVLPGYGAEACHPVTGDGPARVVAWRGTKALPRATVRIEFELTRASLFGFQLIEANDPTEKSGPIQVGNRKQLFIDRRFIARSENVAIMMNPPVKAGVVLECDRPWEDFRLTSYFTVLQDGDRCRMYYSCFSKDQWHTPDAWDKHAYLCYAESTDGIAWTKPELGIVAFEGSKANNILMKSVVDGTVFIDPHAPSARRYKLLSTVGPHKGGLRVSYSADGIHFTMPETPVSPWTPDSQQTAFWDARIGKYVAYLRGRPDMGLEVPNRLVVRVEINDIEKPWHARPQIVLRTDAHDSPEVDFYTNACVRYPWADDAYFMFPAAYHHFPPEMGNDGLLDTSLAVSRDGIRWDRPDRRPYVPLGLRGEWDAFFLMMGVGIVRHGDHLYQYYNGVDLSHGGTRRMTDEQRRKWRRWSKMGRTVQRLDGFCSADAAYEGGWLETPPLVFEGRRLVLNINTSAGGQARVAIADAAGTPLRGFAIADCDTIMANRVAQVVSWKGNPDVSGIAGRPVRLRFEMRSTKLYAFQFAE